MTAGVGNSNRRRDQSLELALENDQGPEAITGFNASRDVRSTAKRGCPPRLSVSPMSGSGEKIGAALRPLALVGKAVADLFYAHRTRQGGATLGAVGYLAYCHRES